MDVRPLAVALEYVDRSRSAPIARGYRRTADTIIQHPTIHHWPSVDSSDGEAILGPVAS
jgi:hypothetical protein